MKINDKIFNFPPHISTSWNNVSSLHMKGSLLIVTLLDGDSINIPGLTQELIEKIFTAHSAFLEQDIATDHANRIMTKRSKLNQQTFLFNQNNHEIDSSFQLGFSSIDEFGSVLQHNPSQGDAPDIPKEVLQKIAAITKIVSPSEILSFPESEPHCNCVHCQIARAITDSDLDACISYNNLSEEKHYEDQASDQDLTFLQWEISPSGHQLFNVTNRLDTKEKYSVYLGQPVGCTCGKQGCEHIVAVLKS